MTDHQEEARACRAAAEILEMRAMRNEALSPNDVATCLVTARFFRKEARRQKALADA